jgi:hypothetical protein
LVSRPAWALNYVLQTTASSGVPMVSVLLTNSVPAAYYRLAWPWQAFNL